VTNSTDVSERQQGADEVLHAIRKTDAQEIRFVVSSFRGKQVLHARMYWRDNGTFRPSRHGWVLPFDDETLEGLESAVDALRQALKARGK
jgi:hypothetical protein